MSNPNNISVGDESMSKQLERKKKLLELMAEAEKLSYEYFSNCDLGAEREAAAQVAENIRLATRVR